MPRKNLIRTDQFPYHVTIRSNNKEWFDLEMNEVWKIFLYSIKIALVKVPVKIESFVLMNNHYHILLYTPNSDLDKFMNILNSSISREFRLKTKRINRIFGDRYKWKLINNENYYKTVIRYIFQNPVKANLVSRCEEYKFSSLYYQVKKNEIGIDLPDEFQDIHYLDYFNHTVSNKEQVDLKKSLNTIGQSHS